MYDGGELRRHELFTNHIQIQQSRYASLVL
jgi:hypothetical protein